MLGTKYLEADYYAAAAADDDNDINVLKFYVLFEHCFTLSYSVLWPPSWNK